MVDLHDYSKMFKTATAGIVVCGNMEKTIEGVEEFWIQDCSAAIENILLRATDLGLGAVWCGAHPQEKVVNKLKDVLSLPEKHIPLGIIHIGYPAESPEPRDQYAENRVHFIE